MIKRGTPTDVSASLGMSISNVICSIIMGVRFQHGDKRFKRFMDLIEEGFKLFGSMAAVNFIPVMRYLPCLQKVRNKIAENRAEMADFFQEAVDQHRATFDESTLRDLVDAYLLEIEKAKGEGRATTLFQGKNHGESAPMIYLVHRQRIFMKFSIFIRIFMDKEMEICLLNVVTSAVLEIFRIVLCAVFVYL